MSQSLLLLPHLPLSPWSYVASFTYFCTSDFAKCGFENGKLFVLLGFFLQTVKLTSCADPCLHCSTQVFSHESRLLMLHELTDSVKVPLMDNVNAKTSTSSNPDGLSKT